MSLFTVIDKQTGKEADAETIAANEEWAADLMLHDLEGFALQQDGTVILIGECGKYIYCPPKRFLVCLNMEQS